MESQTKKLIHFRPFFYSFLILTLAIACAKFVFDGNVSYIILVCGVLAFLVTFCIWRRKIACLVILLIVFGFGIGWYFLGISTFQGKEYSGEYQIVARVSDDISYSEYGQSCNVVLKGVKINGNKAKNIYAKLSFEDKEEIKIGDIISFSAEVERVKPFQLGSFSSFYYRDNVGYSTEISSSQISILKNKMTIDEKIRQKVKTRLSGTKNGAIMYAVLFGDKSDVSDDVKTAFANSGVVHLLTVSGLHISFLIALLGFVLKKCRVRGWANILVCAGFVVFYSFLCGFTPSVLRAGIMGLVLCMATAFGKRYDGLNTLGLAGILILLVKPLFALDVGFLMSFFCVFSIFALCPIFEKLFGKFLPKKVATGIAVSLSAQIGILPFALQISEGVNLLSVFANLLIVPIFSVVYPLLFVTTLLVLAVPIFGFFLKVSDFGFVVVCKLAEFFGQTRTIVNVEPFDVLTIAFGFLLVLSLSRFFMVGKRTKALCCSI